MQCVDTVAKTRPRDAFAAPIPEPERQAQQCVQQPQREQCGNEHQHAADQRGLDGGAEITHQHETGILDQHLRQQRAGKSGEDPEQEVAEEVHVVARNDAITVDTLGFTGKSRITAPAVRASVRACCRE